MDVDIPTQPTANWRDALNRVVEYYNDDKTPSEQQFIDVVGQWLAENACGDLPVAVEILHDLKRGLAERIDNYEQLIRQLEIFMRPTIRFCKTFFEADFFKETCPGWLPEYTVLLVKLRIHAILVPAFSPNFDTSAGRLQVTIGGSEYVVDPNNSIRDLDRSFAPGLSAVTANDRYFAYIHRVTGGDNALIGMYVLMKLLDLSQADDSQLVGDMRQLAFGAFMRVAACARHAYVGKFSDAWQPKMRELAVLFEWAKTFEQSLAALLANISDQSPTPLFAEIFS